MQKMEATTSTRDGHVKSSQAQAVHHSLSNQPEGESYGKAKEISGSKTARRLERGRISENERLLYCPNYKIYFCVTRFGNA